MGHGFGEEPCQNEIFISSHECVAVTTTTTMIECVIDTNNTFIIGKYYLVTLHVRDRGVAINQVMTPAGRAFIMVPSISRLSQYAGSQVGGTKLTIYGDGFSGKSITVKFGSADCVIDDYNYKQIACITTEPVNKVKFAADVMVNGARAVCDGNCDFSYDWRKTLIVTKVTPLEVTEPCNSFTIHGYVSGSSKGFGTDKSAISVTIGGANCAVTYCEADYITCDASYIPVGKADIVVNIRSMGNARFFNETYSHIQSNMQIESVTPKTGSSGGGQLITIIGSTFHVDDTIVAMPGGRCVITSMNVSHIECITPPYGGYGDTKIISGLHVYKGLNYVYSVAQTPQVTSVLPASGQVGDVITITGSAFSLIPSENSIIIDGIPCIVNDSTTDSVTCRVGLHSAGSYVIEVHVQGKGHGISDAKFEYELAISSTSPYQGNKRNNFPSFFNYLHKNPVHCTFEETTIHFV